MDPQAFRYVHEPHTEAVHLVRWMLKGGFLTPEELQDTIGVETASPARPALRQES